MNTNIKPCRNMAAVSYLPDNVSPAEYLTLDRASDRKLEYYAGKIVTMSGASLAHNQIVVNLVVSIGQYLKDKPCSVLCNSMRTCTPASGAYMYPDIAIYCGEPELEDTCFDTLKNPSVIVEVLSPSTEDFDRSRKFLFYRRIPSLKEYFLIDSRQCQVEVFRRQPDLSWKLETVGGLEDKIKIDTIRYQLPMRDVYHQVAAA